MTPDAAVSMLNSQLAKHGEDIELIRTTGLTGPQAAAYGVICRAFVRGYSAEELIAGITQSDSKVILGPTEIEASGWPGPETARETTSGTPISSTTGDIRIPRKNDKAVIAGRQRNIEASVGLYMAGVLVRIEMRVAG